MDNADALNNGLTPLKDIVTDEMMALDLETLVVLLAARIISDPDGASVSRVQWPDNTLVEFALQQKDRGRLLGRNGNVIQAIRTVIRAIQGPDANTHTFRLDLVPDRHSISR